MVATLKLSKPKGLPSIQLMSTPHARWLNSGQAHTRQDIEHPGRNVLEISVLEIVATRKNAVQLLAWLIV